MADLASQPFGAQIRAFRFRRGWSQEQLGENAAVSGAAVYKWETGQSRPYPANLQKLIDALELTDAEASTLRAAYGSGKAAIDGDDATRGSQPTVPVAQSSGIVTPPASSGVGAQHPLQPPPAIQKQATPVTQGRRMRPQAALIIIVLTVIVVGTLAGRLIQTSLQSRTVTRSIPTYAPQPTRNPAWMLTPWKYAAVDTGIDVPARARFTIIAKDHARSGNNPMPEWTPAGNPACTLVNQSSIPRPQFPAPKLPCWALIGEVGRGALFFVGTHVDLTTATGGELYVGDNDNMVADNSGRWTVTITIQP